MPVEGPEGLAGAPPGPGGASTVAELTERLRGLRSWAGMAYRAVHRAVVRSRTLRGVPELPAYDTVYRCFQPGRSRLDAELVADIVQVLLPDGGPVEQWRQACRVILDRGSAAAVVEVTDALPDDLDGFAGRRRELARIAELAATTGLTSAVTPGANSGVNSGVTAIAIDGMPGVGKTRLAVHAGHRLQRQFGDLQLAVDLRGHHPDRPPADPAAVLDAFLRRLGLPGERIQRLDLAGRAARYRQLLAGRQVLVLLDNAASAEQVRPLLPATPGCLALVTSRCVLSDLAGVPRLSLEPFPPEESVALLVGAAGEEPADRGPADRGPAGPGSADRGPADRGSAGQGSADRGTAGSPGAGWEPGPAARIAELLGHLPLALALVAARIRANPDWTLADHLDRLVQRRDVLRLDDGVEVMLGLSYETLPPPARRTFRLLALHPGGDLDAPAAAALAGTDLATAQAHLAHLAANHLLLQPVGGRYRFHDLIRVYATNRAYDEDPARSRRAALTRLLAYYEYAAAAAMDLYSPHDTAQRPRVPEPGTPAPRPADAESAIAWLETERANLVATAGAARHGWPARIGELSDLLWYFLFVRGYHADGLVLHGLALEAARERADPAAESRARRNLGTVHHQLGHNAEAKDQLERAVATSRRAGDGPVQAFALDYLGLVHQATGDYRGALGHHRRAAALARRAGRPEIESGALVNLGLANMRLGQLDEGARLLRQAIAVSRRTGDALGAAAALNNLGLVLRRLGRGEEALHHFQQALEAAREAGHHEGETYGLVNVGQAYGQLGRHDLAYEHQLRALDIARDHGLPALETIARNRLGATARALGAADGALGHHAEALRIARSSGDRYEQAKAHQGIGGAYHDLHRDRAARRHWLRAEALYARLQVPEVAEVRAQLAALNGAVPRPTADPAPGPAQDPAPGPAAATVGQVASLQQARTSDGEGGGTR